MTTEAIESALKSLRNLPAPVRSWRVEIGQDATDDEAVWVWATLDDDWPDIDTRNQIRDVIRDKVSETTGKGPWVYVRFRTVSEVQGI